jgi:hypothetical protein
MLLHAHPLRCKVSTLFSAHGSKLCLALIYIPFFMLKYIDLIRTNHSHKLFCMFNFYFLSVFEMATLERKGIYWPQKISTECLLKKCKCHSIRTEMRKRRFRWWGHEPNLPQDRIPKVALRWTIPGKRKPSKPRTT